MKLQWTAAARADRARIVRAIARDNLTAARKMNQKLGDSARKLLIHPNRGRQGRRESTRELVVHPNYLLIYTIDEENVIVLAVLHAAQRWP